MYSMNFSGFPGPGQEGQALGLSIVKGFVEAQDGTVEIENRKNGGARITVRIPSDLPGIDQRQ